MDTVDIPQKATSSFLTAPHETDSGLDTLCNMRNLGLLPDETNLFL